MIHRGIIQMKDNTTDKGLILMKDNTTGVNADEGQHDRVIEDDGQLIRVKFDGQHNRQRVNTNEGQHDRGLILMEDNTTDRGLILMDNLTGRGLIPMKDNTTDKGLILVKDRRLMLMKDNMMYRVNTYEGQHDRQKVAIDEGQHDRHNANTNYYQTTYLENF
ncbi:hypothetical protein SNE40_004873 [Patella caerulea]|uniref:Uncharacterized protein n=1 Tax=Patella caerulea TaxID=87958 RepID=A0AAN8KAK9_PATCE